MKFPGIGDYLTSFASASDCFATFKDIELIINADGEPTYHSGNFGVVFKVQTGLGLRAVKCFTREQIGRSGAYAKISCGMPCSKYIIDYRYLKDELLASAGGGVVQSYPVLDMEWIEGSTLSEHIERACAASDGAMLESLSHSFDDMAQWLLNQDFAHGDIKPDNIIVTSSGDFRLIDYDGVFMPSMRCEMQREYGTEGFQHPLRATMPFGKAIDHYSIALLSLTLRALSFEPRFYDKFANRAPGMLFNPAQAVDGSSRFINFLLTTPLRELALTRCVMSASPVVDDLQCAIAEKRYFDKMELFTALQPTKVGDKWGYADPTQTMRIAPLYDSVEEFVFDSAAVCLNGLWGYIDRNGKALCRFKFDNAWSFGESDLAMVKYKGKYGFVGKDCRLKIAARYNYAAPFCEGFALAALDNRYGYINTKGRWVVDPIYDYAGNVHNGHSTAELGGKFIHLSF